MIRINLHYSDKLKKGSERSVILILGPLLPSFIIVLTIFLVLMFIQAGQERSVSNLRQEERTIERAVEELRPQVALSRSEIEDLEHKEKVIQILMGKERISWTDNLQMLARVIPDQVFMYRLNLTENVDQRAGRTGTQQRTEPVITYNLQLQGFAQADDMDKELRLIADFINSLRRDSLFQRNFQRDVVFSSTEKVSVANEVVSLFVLNVTPRTPGQ